MDDFQKSVFIEYFLNSIDLICEKSNTDLVLDVFDSINQGFNLDKKTKEFKQTYLNPYKNLEERKIELAKDFFKKELLQIKKNLKPKEAQSYKTLKEVKRKNWLNNDQFKILVYFDFAAKNYAYLKLIQALEDAFEIEFLFMSTLLNISSKKIIQNFDRVFSKKLVEIKHYGSSKYIAYFTPFDKSVSAYKNYENIAYKYNKAV
ncbi:MAG: hypothetical protein IJW73_05515 [Candidatus Gastranaerophilales bacterium]|nr:hypothetical protein [Candidatus Gastranaerophilales bacterium]